MRGVDDPSTACVGPIRTRYDDVTANERGPRFAPRPSTERVSTTSDNDKCIASMVRGWQPCEVGRCVRPAARSLGSQLICEDHLRRFLVPLRRKYFYLDHNVQLDEPIGVGVFHAIAPSHPDGYVVLQCDHGECLGTWVDKHATFPICKWCRSHVLRKMFCL